ncbi:MAG: sialidase family protein [Armatimonadota bacterium]
MRWRWLVVVFPLAACCAVAAAQSGLRTETITEVREGEPVIWREFEQAQPSEAVIVAEESDGPGMYGEDPPEDFWGVRHPAWTPALLNAHGRPPDLILDPGRTETCDIYLGLRAVDPIMTFGIRLSSEKEFTIITAPAATPNGHYDFEFLWKTRVPMAGEEIVLRALGKPLYLQYLRFVPHVEVTRQLRVPRERVTIMREEGRHFAFPGVAELPDGDLVVVCREGDAHVCPRGRIVMSRSSDGGRSWSPREVVYDSPSDERDPAAIVLADGTLAVSFCTWDSWRGSPRLRERYAEETAHMEEVGWGTYSGARIMLSADGGETWSEPRPSPVFSPHGPVQGPDGALYWVGKESRDGARVIAIWRSDDLGESWARFSEVSYSPPPSAADRLPVWDEPNIIFLPGERAICTLRVEVDGYVRHAVSTDGGRTWGWPHRLGVWGFPQHLCRLADGRLLMSYGYRRDPMGVRACLSGDGGDTWDLDEEIVFRRQGGNPDLGYPYTIQLRDGRVFTVYYYNHQGGDCYIEGAFYRP